MREISFGSVYEEIKVNKNGDTLKIPVGDNTFKDKFFDMFNSYAKMQKEAEKKYEELTKDVEDEIELKNIDHQLEDEYTKKICSMIDDIFGENTMKKCYPDAKKPNILMIADFLANIKVTISEIYGEREQKINNKYNKRRKGAKS